VNFYFQALITGYRYAPVKGPKYEIVAAERKTSPINRNNYYPID